MSEERKNSEALSLSSVVDRHRGQKFLVCGTGPSIDQFPKSFYEEWEGVTIGVNAVLDLFTPRYHINIHERPNLIRDNVENIDLVFKYHNPSTQIDPKKSGLLSMVGTVALIAMTAAYQLGASDIYLIGVDLKVSPGRHHFNGCSSEYWDDDNPVTEECLKQWKVDHPDKSYPTRMTHVINNIDELRATIRSFDRATKLYQEQGIKIVNLSKDSILEVA